MRSVTIKKSLAREREGRESGAGTGALLVPQPLVQAIAQPGEGLGVDLSHCFELTDQALWVPHALGFQDVELHRAEGLHCLLRLRRWREGAPARFVRG